MGDTGTLFQIRMETAQALPTALSFYDDVEVLLGFGSKLTVVNSFAHNRFVEMNHTGILMVDVVFDVNVCVDAML